MYTKEIKGERKEALTKRRTSVLMGAIHSTKTFSPKFLLTLFIFIFLFLISLISAQLPTPILQTEGAWTVTHTTDYNYTYYINNPSIKKTTIGLIPKDNSCIGKPLTKRLYYSNGTAIMDDKNKPIDLKCASSKCGDKNCYSITLTTAQAVNINEYIKIGNQSTTFEWKNSTLYIYRTDKIEFNNLTLEIYFDGVKQTVSNLNWSSNSPIGNGVKFNVNINGFTYRKNVTFRVNELNKQECSINTFSRTCSNSQISFEAFEHINPNLTKTITKVYSNGTQTWYVNLWQNFLSLFGVQPNVQLIGYDITYRGAIRDLDPSFEETITTSTSGIFNFTEASSNGLRLIASSLHYDFNTNESSSAKDNSIYGNTGALNGNVTWNSNTGYDGSGALTFGSDGVLNMTVPQAKKTISWWQKNGTNAWEFIVNSSGVVYVNGLVASPSAYPVYPSGDIFQVGSQSIAESCTGTPTQSYCYNYYNEMDCEANTGHNSDCTWFLGPCYDMIYCGNNYDEGSCNTYSPYCYWDGWGCYSNNYCYNTYGYNQASCELDANCYFAGSCSYTLGDGSITCANQIIGGQSACEYEMCSYASASINPFNGQIDQFMMFKDALTSSQVLQLFNGTKNNSNYIKTYTYGGDWIYGTFYNVSSPYWNITLSLDKKNQTNSSIVYSGANITLQTRTADGYNLTDTNLVSFWNMNTGNATFTPDVMKRNNATVTGATFTSDGAFQNAYSFDGTDRIVATGYKGVLGNKSMTTSAWIKTSSATYQNIINWGIYGGGGNQGHGIEFDVVGSAGGHTQVYIYGNAGYSVVGSKVVNDGNWHNVVFTYGNNNGTIYVDGVLDASGTLYIDITSGVDVALGLRMINGWNDSPFVGTLDEVRVYNRTLSGAEVADLYNTYGLVGWSNWSDEMTMTSGVPKTSPTNGSYMQFKTNLYSNDTSITPVIINYSITSGEAPVGCTPQWLNTSWGNWVNLNCVSNDRNQTRNATQYDNNTCIGSTNVTLYEYNLSLANLTYTPWSDYINTTCSGEQMNQSSNRTQYDSNALGCFNNITSYQYQLVGPSWINTSYGAWWNVSCVYGDIMNTSQNLTQYDSYTCGTNTTYITFGINGVCNYATPTVNILSPLEGSIKGLVFPFSFTATDTNISNKWYGWLGSNLTFTSVLDLYASAGNYNICAYANDTFGAIGYDCNSFTTRDFDTNTTTECSSYGSNYVLLGNGTCAYYYGNQTSGTSPVVNSNIQTCRYKKLGYYNTKLVWLKGGNCI